MALVSVLQFALFLLCPRLISGHGSMYEPPSRNSQGMSVLGPTCAGGACQWYSQGCSIGCPIASQKYSSAPDCDNPAEPTLTFETDPHLLQYLTDGYGSDTTYFPWRYPGAAPVLDSCGVTGGGFPPDGQLDPPPGRPAGLRGSDTKNLPILLEKTTWIAGTNVEVAWGMAANHGGGYQYRLCPIDQALNEECFRKLPLEFVGDKQWIQFGNGYDRKTRREISAVRVGGKKVLPVDSTWTKNPIPGCRENGARGRKPCLGPTATGPFPDDKFKYSGTNQSGLFGYGGGHCMGNKTKDPNVVCTLKEYGDSNFDFGIVDIVKVPNVPPGKYVISFRWDCEQTKQVWNSCGDVTIEDKKPSVRATVPFSEQRGCTACCAPSGLCSNCTTCLNDKTGACEYCWKEMKWWDNRDFWSPRSPNLQCLQDGPGNKDWLPGQPLSPPFSPDCRQCWADKDGCSVYTRQVESEASGASTNSHTVKIGYILLFLAIAF